MPVVELTGVPCSGKSYFINRLKESYKHESDVIFFSNEIILDFLCLSRLRGRLCQFIVEIYLLGTLVTYNRKYISSIFRLFKLIKKLRIKPFTKINLYRNVILKFCKLGFTERNIPGYIVIFDEGISHIPFNILSEDLLDKNDSKSIFYLFQDALVNVNVVALDSENINIYLRLKSRGHKRLNGKSDSYIKRFTVKQEEIYKSSISCFGLFCRSFQLVMSENTADWKGLDKLLQTKKRR